jgi:hypothetical protein
MKTSYSLFLATTALFVILFIILPHSTTAQAPSTWFCADALYNAGDHICNCGCGAPDPDCIISNNATVNNTNPVDNGTAVSVTLVGCPCEGMVCI